MTDKVDLSLLPGWTGEEESLAAKQKAKDDGDVDLVALGAAMVGRKKELVDMMKSAGVPIPATRSMKGASLKRTTPVA